MLTRNQIKYVHGLGRKSHRAEHQQFVVEGDKLVNELLSSSFEIDEIYATSGHNLPENVAVTLISEKDLGRMSQLKSPNKVLAVVNWPSADFEISELTGVTLFLDRINDPGNLGTIIRLADWFGIGQVICSEESVDVFNSKVIQSSMGSVFRVPVQYVSAQIFLEDYQQAHENAPIISAEMEGELLQKMEFPEKMLLVMGSESHGVHPNLAPFISQKATIPRIGGAESLNVANATSMFLWEIFR